MADGPTFFDAASAVRIANAVRKVEIGDRAERPLTFRRESTQQRKSFRVCTFTGAWSINAAKTITFKNVTSTPNTVVAVNLFAAVPSPPGTAHCAIARDGSAWYLIAAVCS